MDYQKNALEYIKSLGNQFYEGDKKRFVDLCVASELNPFLGDITYQPRKNKEGKLSKGSLVTSFEVYLAKASATDSFLGLQDYEIVDENGSLIAVKVVAKREIKSGSVAEMSFTAKLSEFKPKKINDFSPWVTMPYVMLRKCALANAVRQLFADRVKLPYLSEELEQSEQVYNNSDDNQAIQSDTPPKKPVENKETQKNVPTNEMEAIDFLALLNKGNFTEAIKDEKRLERAYMTIKNYFITNYPTLPVSAKPSIEAALNLYAELQKKCQPVGGSESSYDPLDEKLDYLPVVNQIVDEGDIAKIYEIEGNFESLGGTLPESFVSWLKSQYTKAYGVEPVKQQDLIELIEAVKNAIGE